ncbi:hypothetical protein MUK42_02160 [Musa troglodytarum]|uniref:Uncharacterized protein n=1 Tax=Musa troglodytarum TaxID=320322 RepID=A0A9E7ESD9_9LILI|nr:hypothetical protein MUK42_02160 [Musa troglodytarum]
MMLPPVSRLQQRQPNRDPISAGRRRNVDRVRREGDEDKGVPNFRPAGTEAGSRENISTWACGGPDLLGNASPFFTSDHVISSSPLMNPSKDWNRCMNVNGNWCCCFC